MTRIEINDVSLHYPRQPQPTLAHLSLRVADGELLALLGPSGSGKSTLLRLIAGLLEPTSGDIRFDGHSQRGVPAQQREAVLMFQKAYLFPFLNVADNIRFGLRVRGVPRPAQQAAVQRMLALVELAGTERRYPAQLSGGQQQRIALARALVTQPRVLLLDEPFSSLDTAVRRTLQEAVRRIQRDTGVTTLLVTHDLDEALMMADRVAVLLDGQIAALGTPREVYSRPPTHAAARFVGVSTFLAGTLHGTRLDTPAGNLHVALPDPPAHPRPALFAVRPEQMQIQPTAIADRQNCLPATVQECIYRGDTTEYVLAVRGLPEGVRVRCPATDHPHAAGTAVWLHIPPAALWEVAGQPPTPPARQS